MSNESLPPKTGNEQSPEFLITPEQAFSASDELVELSAAILDIKKRLTSLESTAERLITRLNELNKEAGAVQRLPLEWRARVNELIQEAQELHNYSVRVESLHGFTSDDPYLVKRYLADDPPAGRMYLKSIEDRNKYILEASRLNKQITNSQDEINTRLEPINSKKIKILGKLLDLAVEYDELNIKVLTVISGASLSDGLEPIASWDRKGAAEYFEKTGIALNEIQRLHDSLVVD